MTNIKLSVSVGAFNLLDRTDVRGRVHFRWGGDEGDFINLPVSQAFAEAIDLSRDDWEDVVLNAAYEFESGYMVWGEQKKKLERIRELLTSDNDDFRVELQKAQERYQIVPMLRRLKNRDIPALMKEYEGEL